MSKTTFELFKTCNSWSEAVQKSNGNEEKELISALLSNFARNSPWIQKPSANLDSRLIELFAAFLYSLRFISPSRTPIKVADLGGGNGYMGYYISKLFPELHWV
jgi:hypothetical protein